MDTAERLQSYYNFSDETLAATESVAGYQSTFSSYQQYFEKGLGIPDGPKYTRDGQHQVIDIRPPEHDPKMAMVVHLPLANPLDANQIFQVGTIANTNPHLRVIAFGNPSGPGYQAGMLYKQARIRVTRGDFAPVVEPVKRYLDNAHIERVHHVGASYGADLAAEAAADGSYHTEHLVPIEPAAIKFWKLREFAKAFKSSALPLQGYVKAANQPLYMAARQDSVKGVAYNLGIARLSNIAAIRGLARGGFERRVDRALQEQPQARATIIWGSESELAIDGIVNSIVSSLQGLHPRRVAAIRLRGQKHSLVNDIYLHAALVREALN